MKPDDRDIVCETDYSPLSNAELVAHIQLYADLMHNTPLSDGEWLDDIIGPARVLMARAEAAEAEAARLKEAGRMVQEEVTAWRDSYAALNEQRLALAARVAELEAELAAQGWRPVTEDWPPYNERVIIGHGGGYGGGWSAFARRVRTDNRDGDDWLMDDDTTLAFESAVVAMRRPLPPAPQERTP